jgi:excisionase family DNA binding protein
VRQLGRRAPGGVVGRRQRTRGFLTGISASNWHSTLKILLAAVVKGPVRADKEVDLRGTAIADFFVQLTKKGVIMVDDQDVLTVKEISDLLHVRPSTIYKLIRQGKIPAFRIGSDWRFRKDAIMRWMAENSMHIRQVRAALDSRVNGQSQHRRMTSSRGRKR